MEEKINLLYNFLYNSSFNNCFNIDKITLGKIGLDDIKLTDEKEIEDCLNEINEGKFTYMDYNEKNSLILLKRYSDSYPVTIKIGTYTGDINELSNDSRNQRAVYDGYKTQRGAILVNNEPIAESIKTADAFHYLRKYSSQKYSSLTGFYSLYQGRIGLENLLPNY